MEPVRERRQNRGRRKEDGKRRPGSSLLVALFIVVMVSTAVIIVLNTKQMAWVENQQETLEENQECVVRLLLEKPEVRQELRVQEVLDSCPSRLRREVEEIDPGT